MYIGVISMRYAKALLAYADEKGTEDTVYEEAGILAYSFSRIPELRQALDNPVLPAETKLKLICEAAGGGQVSEELRFLRKTFSAMSTDSTATWRRMSLIALSFSA